MTLNFGHKLLIAFILFGAIMLYLVYQTLQTDYELVSKNYYQDELEYQQVIDATKNANDLGSKTVISQQGNEILLQLPKEMYNQSISGRINFYCPSDSKKDRNFTLAPDPAGHQVIPIDKDISTASYRVRVSWMANNKKYYQDSYLQVK
ncbi:FixH family protein [Flavihumibacter profundi]|jgi:hypothetical protein|uniref:FixH family protein n=1 Tax=Flavihumibacter profundi TaxID=2716883 RepID=UPI001CC46246|nr:FixH family protein [Flavihumibacter profundi]MBZ5859512.1 FixH family protein [Flavihumibacter profundi]